MNNIVEEISDQGKIRFTSWNVAGALKTCEDKGLSLISDFTFLAECDGFDKFNSWIKERFYRYISGRYQQAIYSSFPIKQFSHIKDPLITKQLLRSVVDVRGLKVTVYALHLINPSNSKENSEVQNKEVGRILEIIQAETAFKNTIILGDFNTRALSDGENELTDQLPRFLNAGFVDTYKHLHPNTFMATKILRTNLNKRIDYVLISNDLLPNLLSAGIVETGSELSDHRPVWVELSCHELATSRQQASLIQEDPLTDLKKRLKTVREQERGQTFTLLNHNIFWQQGMPYESKGEHPPIPAIKNELIKLYYSLDVDFLCLQELQSENACKDIADAFGFKNWQWTPGKNQKPYGIMMASSYSGEFTDHRTWDLPDEDTPQRALMTFQIHQGLKIANLHLPSGRNLSTRTKEQSHVSEIELLMEQQPDLVVGDFNALHFEEAGNILRSRGYAHASDSPFGNQNRTCVKQPREIDHVWLRKELLEQVLLYEPLPIVCMKKVIKDKSAISDHIPLILVLKFGASA
jgi:endonuclease/exonuclease/phosphatase family metal-dependent hydrolase